MSQEDENPLDDFSDQQLVDELARRCDDLIVLMQHNLADTGRKPHDCDIFRAGNPFTHVGMVEFARWRCESAIKTEVVN